ncbi:MAG: hypothetical protein MUF43_03380 [Flavobacterium sp.]|jgi:hypothetical protein|nr:hypothetical protein [Flavobacterium sp.]
MLNKKKALKITAVIIGLLLLMISISNFIWINERETVFYKIQQYLTYNKEDWKNYEDYKKNISNTNNIQVDTVYTISKSSLYPYDINRLSGSAKENELNKIKSAHFEKLTLATTTPTDEDAQIALIRLTQGRLTDVIIHQKLNIKVGKCYQNPNTEGNYNCVSCMILLYNREKKDWQEAPNGDNFLENSYDFYQPSQGETWEAKDLSQMIPYDYELIKKYEQK